MNTFLASLGPAFRGSRFYFLAICAGFLVVAGPFVSPANARTLDATEAGLIIKNADNMSTDFKNKTTALSGNVQVIFRGQHLSCDSVVIDYRSKRIEALGHIRFQTLTVYSEATKLTLNYEDGTATMQDGYIRSGQVVFEGKVIQKTGPNQFVALEGNYTACESCPPTWSFSGQRIEAELGGYARITRPILRFGGIPVMILPGILVPLKSSRQSGFLVPSFNHTGKGGLAFGETFFWAIDRSHDATFGAKHYELRGTKALGEYRYVMSEASKGLVKSAYLRDRAFLHEGKSVDRWFVDYTHYYQLPGDYIQRVNIQQISDLRYLRDFPDEILGHGNPGLENRLSLTKNSEHQNMSIETSYHVNLLKEYPLSNNTDSVHRAPEIHYSLTEVEIPNTPFMFRFDSIYNNFARSGYSYDDLNPSTTCRGLENPRCVTQGSKDEVLRDGTFTPATDLIRTGQRFEMRPSLSLPFQLFKSFEVLPQLSFREMQYRFDIDSVSANQNFGPTAAQRYIEADVSAKTSLSHIYGNQDADQSIRYKHEVVPQISYSTIPWSKRSDHGFFGDFAGQRYARILDPISDKDVFGRNKLQFDYNDRLFDKELVELALTNYLTRKRWLNNLPDYQRIATFRLAQAFDIKESATNKPQPWSAINGLLNVKLDNFETYTTANYNPYAKVTDTSMRIKLLSERGDFVQVAYTKLYLINENNEVVNRNATENIGMGIGFRSRFLDLAGQIDYSAVTNKVLSWEYLAQLKPPGNCWVIKIGHSQVIGGDRDFRFNMNFEFGGEQVKNL